MDDCAKTLHSTDMLQILVIAGDNNAGATYLRLLEQAGAKGTLASETDAILHVMRTVPTNGIIVNMPTFLRLHGEGKSSFTDVLTRFPVLRCRVDKDSETLTVFEQGQENPEKSLSRFLSQCADIPARTIRAVERVAATYAVLLSSASAFAPAQTERTITINVTEQGAFCFSTQMWRPGSTAWLQFLDLADKTPIAAEVVHSVRWSKGGRVPGCGMKFTSITPTQRAELAELLKKFTTPQGTSQP